MGILLPEMLLVHFDSAGRYQRIEVRPLKGTYVAHDDSGALQELRDWQKELHFAPSPIRVRIFFEANRTIGIRALPDHYQEAIDYPETFEPSRLKLLLDDVQEWRARGDFVFYWGEDYYLDKEGDVVSS
jgi:hypothetical protein